MSKIFNKVALGDAEHSYTIEDFEALESRLNEALSPILNEFGYTGTGSFSVDDLTGTIEVERSPSEVIRRCGVCEKEYTTNALRTCQSSIIDANYKYCQRCYDEAAEPRGSVDIQIGSVGALDLSVKDTTVWYEGEYMSADKWLHIVTKKRKELNNG